MPNEKEPPRGIHGALLEFQKLSVSVKKAGTNPAFHSKYMELSDVLEAVQGPLNDLGVLIMQIPRETGLETVLTCVEDGSSVNSFIPYTDVSNAQKLGGCVTYARRYALVSMLGLNDEDDDGNAASAPKPSSAVARNFSPTYDPSPWDAQSGADGQGTAIEVETVFNGTGKTGKPYTSLNLSDGKRLFDNTGTIRERGRYSVELTPDGKAVARVL